ncbi:hypothetical protein MKX01_002105 [Papaver californicum]|nr:hypothetical protein MKX01_002105 [Papaver californicum]
MVSLQKIIAETIERNTLLRKDQMNMISNDITSVIHQIVVNGSALISSTQSQTLDGKSPFIPNNFINHQHTVLDSSSAGGLISQNREQIKGKSFESRFQMCFTNPEKMKNSVDSSEGNYINSEFNFRLEKLLTVKKDFTIDEQIDNIMIVENQ